MMENLRLCFVHFLKCLKLLKHLNVLALVCCSMLAFSGCNSGRSSGGDAKNGEMPACTTVPTGEYKKQAPSWKPLIDHSDFQGFRKMETFPLSIAILY